MFCAFILASFALLFVIVYTATVVGEWIASRSPGPRDRAGAGVIAKLHAAPVVASLIILPVAPARAASNPMLMAALGPGEWIIGAAAAVTAIGAILAFIRREAQHREPPPERKVSGGPVEVAMLERGVERYEHDDLKQTVARHKVETWEVIDGLRRSVSKIEADIAGLRAQREANGERLTELSGDIKGLSKLVHRLAGIVETKLEGARE